MSGLKLLTQSEAQLVSGPHDIYLHMVRKQFGVDIVIRDLHVVVSGDDTERRAAAARLLGVLVARARSEGRLSQDEVEALLADEALGRKAAEVPSATRTSMFAPP